MIYHKETQHRRQQNYLEDSEDQTLGLLIIKDKTEYPCWLVMEFLYSVPYYGENTPGIGRHNCHSGIGTAARHVHREPLQICSNMYSDNRLIDIISHYLPRGILLVLYTHIIYTTPQTL